MWTSVFALFFSCFGRICCVSSGGSGIRSFACLFLFAVFLACYSNLLVVVFEFQSCARKKKRAKKKKKKKKALFSRASLVFVFLCCLSFSRVCDEGSDVFWQDDGAFSSDQALHCCS